MKIAQSFGSSNQGEVRNGIHSYIVPAPHWGWLAVAEVPVEWSRYWLPPKHQRWRPTKDMAYGAVPKAREAVVRDLERRDRGRVRNKKREQLKEEVR